MSCHQNIVPSYSPFLIFNGGFMKKLSRCLLQGLVNVFLDVLYILQTDGEPDKVFCYSCLFLFFASQLLVGCRRGMNDKALRISDIGEVG
jgi:hypothetical protein